MYVYRIPEGNWFVTSENWTKCLFGLIKKGSSYINVLSRIKSQTDWDIIIKNMMERYDKRTVK